MMTPIHILVTLDENYLPPLRVMLTSLFVNNPGEKIEVWMLYRSIPGIEINNLRELCENYNAVLHPLRADGSMWGSAPTSSRYPQEMYYRLLAPHLLPGTFDRVLYLDPDILVINPLRPLWRSNTIISIPAFCLLTLSRGEKKLIRRRCSNIRKNIKKSYYFPIRIS